MWPIALAEVPSRGKGAEGGRHEWLRKRLSVTGGWEAMHGGCNPVGGLSRAHRGGAWPPLLQNARGQGRQAQSGGWPSFTDSPTALSSASVARPGRSLRMEKQ